jgi:ATP-dependent Clp protease ATP-binding subunit ClpA
MPSILLVDELEKAHEKLRDMMLGILDKGELMNTKGEVVRFHKTVIIMTSNLGAGEIAAIMDGGMGYRAQKSEPTPERMRAAAMLRYTKETRPEFQNRIDKVVVFKNLTLDDLENVLSVEMSRIQMRVFNSKEPFFFHLMTPARKALLMEGFSPKYGARELKRVLDRRIVTPLARMVSSKQIVSGNHIAIHYMDGDYRFINEDITNEDRSRANSGKQQYRN